MTGPLPVPAPRPATPAPDPPPPGVRIPPATAGSGAPPYTLGRRFTDWRRARRDGRAGLPGVEPGRPQGTPALEELAQDFLARCHAERLRLDVELAPLLESEAALLVRIGQDETAARAARERRDAWPSLLDDDQLGLRRGGESLTSADVVRARRAREYEALRRPLVDEADRISHRITATREELARVRAAVRAREVVGATRVRRLHAQTMRRISAYERHLVRHHPARDRVGPVLVAQHPRIPGWVFAAEDPDVPHPAATPPGGLPGAVPPPDPAPGTGRHSVPGREV